MKINIVSDEESWINKYIKVFIDQQKSNNSIFWFHDMKSIKSGDICFLLGCSQFMNQENRKKNKNNLVVHESNLPKGRGWSPLTWQILDGKNIIPISIIEVEEKIDSGLIYGQEFMHFEGHELVNELRYIQAKHTFSLCDKFIKEYPNIVKEGKKQFGDPTSFKRRTPKDSQLNIKETIENQFNLLRVCDNLRYPAFIKIDNHKYKITIEKIEK